MNRQLKSTAGTALIMVAVLLLMPLSALAPAEPSRADEPGRLQPGQSGPAREPSFFKSFRGLHLEYHLECI